MLSTVLAIAACTSLNGDSETVAPFPTEVTVADAEAELGWRLLRPASEEYQLEGYASYVDERRGARGAFLRFNQQEIPTTGLASGEPPVFKDLSLLQGPSSYLPDLQHGLQRAKKMHTERVGAYDGQFWEFEGNGGIATFRTSEDDIFAMVFADSNDDARAFIRDLRYE